MKKILITGGAGFIGSAVVRLFVNQGFEVTNIDALTYASSSRNLSSVHSAPNSTFICANILDQKALEKIFIDCEPDAVIHLAAESHVDRSINAPSIFVETNIRGTFNLLETSLKHWQDRGRPRKFRFYHISTDEVFGSATSDTKFTEQTRYNPSNPYSASKAASDHLVQVFNKTYGLPTLISHSSNNYGPFQHSEKFFPVVILNAINNKPVPIYGSGNNIRDWLYVDDHARAIMVVLLKGSCGETYNIGGNCEVSNIELAQKIFSCLDRVYPNRAPHSKQLSFVSDRPGHDFRYSIDASKIKNELGWEAETPIDHGIEKTVQWFTKTKTTTDQIKIKTKGYSGKNT
ncbi:dTDP-glucose 4,6-dehydratase [Alphaproteobacteria bacterium]|nr:dTDP-glucose 4,6-dehydratase [Alphaproteobacteria bacterium]